MLTEITVLRFKAIEEMELPLDRINLLIGSNSSGKSSVLQAIQFAISTAQTMKQLGAEWKKGTMQLSFPANELVYSPLRDIAALRHGGYFGESYLGIEIRFKSSVSSPNIPVKESFTPIAELLTTVKINKGRGQYIKCSIGGPDLGKMLSEMKQPYSIFVPGLAGIPIEEEFKSEVLVRKAATRGDANNVFRNVLLLLKQNASAWTKFLVNFEDVFPGQSIRVSFRADRDEQINCEVRKQFSTQWLPVDSAGTGVMQAIQILAYINLYRPKLLILDEPDAHLHPNNQRRLIRLVSELATTDDFQVILSIHSRHILEELQITARKHWIRKGKRVNDVEYDNIAALFDVGALDKGDLLKSGKIKCVILTEDEDVSVLETLTRAANFRMDESEIWSYRGCSNLDTALALCGFIRSHAPAAKVVIHRDRDYLTPDEVAEYVNRIKKGFPSAFVFVTNGTDAESHFLNPEHYHHLAPKVVLENARKLLEQATLDVAEFSKTAFINSRTQIDAARLRKENKQVNHGELALNCSKLYESDSDRYRHGKKVLKRVRHLFQEAKLQVNPIASSKYVASPELVLIAKVIWPIAATSESKA